jgi:alpha-1,2-mannosyltransferase
LSRPLWFSWAVMSRSSRDPVPGFSPFTRALALFALVNCLVINLALFYSPWQRQVYTVLRYTEVFFKQIAHDDSWRPMRAALRYLDEPGEKPLYQHIFFDQRTKFQYPPTSLLPLEPLRRSPFGDLTSDLVLNRISWLAVFAMALIVARILVLCSERELGAAGRDRYTGYWAQALLAVCFTLTFYPLVRSYYGGQIQTWIDLLFAALLWAWLVGRKGLSGVLAGIICIIKPTLLLLAVWALLRKQWRFATGGAIAVGIGGVLSLWLYGFESHVDYLSVLSFISQHGESFHANQSVNGTLNRMLFNGNNLVWEANLFAPYHLWVYAGTTASSLLLIAMALFFRRRESGRAELTDLLIASLSFTLAAPIVWEHHYGVVLPVFAAVLPAVVGSKRSGPATLWLLGLAYVFISNNFRVLNRLAESHWNFLQSYVFFAGLLLLVLLYRLRRAQAGDASESAASRAANQRSASSNASSSAAPKT